MKFPSGSDSQPGEFLLYSSLSEKAADGAVTWKPCQEKRGILNVDYHPCHPQRRPA